MSADAVSDEELGDAAIFLDRDGIINELALDPEQVREWFLEGRIVVARRLCPAEVSQHRRNEGGASQRQRG